MRMPTTAFSAVPLPQTREARGERRSGVERKERFTEAVAVQAKLSGCKEILRSARLALNDSLKGEATGVPYK